MTWRDRLQPGSFAGIAFRTVSSTDSFWHRNVVRESPFRPNATSQLLGKSPRVFDIEAMFLGEDYDLDLKRFLDRVELDPVGDLVHWVYGSHHVTISSKVEVSHSTREGGMCVVRFTATQTPKFGNGVTFAESEQRSPEGLARSAADLADEAAISDFEAALAFAGELSDVQQQIADDMVAAMEEMQTAINSVIAVTALPGEIVDNSMRVVSAGIGAVSSNFSELVTNVTDLLAAPGAFMDNLKNELSLFGAAFDRLQDGVDSLNNAARTDPGANVASSTTNLTKAENSQLARSTTRTLYATTMIRSLLDLGADLGTVDDATGILAAIRSMVDESQRYDAPDDEAINHLYTSLAAAADFVDDLVTSGDLNQIVTYEVPHDMPAVVISQLFYGDSTGEAGIVDRNDPPHPLIVAGGGTITLLARVDT